MARSGKVDPLEKFRFKVTVVSIDLSIESAVTTIAGLVSNPNNDIKKRLAILSRAGFNKISPLPKATVKTITYRENLDNLRSIKVPGLVTYNDITLSRGATEDNRDLYDWYRLVNDEIALISVANELSKDNNATVKQTDVFRKDVVIEVLNREGKAIKAWYLFNAWPTSYTPGSSLDAAAEEKLVEELSLTYESFIELEGGIDGLAKELAKGLTIIAGESILDEIF